MNASQRFGNASTHLGLAAGVLLAIGGAFMACGGDDSGKNSDTNPSTGDDDTGGGALAIHFSPMYSAYDGVHTFKLPVVVEGVDSKGNVAVVTGVTFKASDPSKVDIENTADGAMLTMKGAGVVKITASKGGVSSSATLTITQSTPDKWQAGSDRYNVMKTALPNGAMLTSFASIDHGGACTTCHGQTALIFKVMHTPQQTGGYSDDDLKNIFLHGMKPDGFAQRTGIPECLWGMGHQWDVPDPDGLVTFLRSIDPQTQGCFDFPMPNFGDAGFRIPTGLFGGGSDAGACGASLPIPSGICSFITDGGINIPGFGDGGFRFPGLGDGGFTLPTGTTGGGEASDAGTSTTTTTTTTTTAADAGTSSTTTTTATADAGT